MDPVRVLLLSVTSEEEREAPRADPLRWGRTTGGQVPAQALTEAPGGVRVAAGWRYLEVAAVEKA